MANPAQDSNSLQAYLKLVVVLVNDHSDAVDLKLGRPLRLQDLDSLSSDNMLKIVVFLLTMSGVIGEKPLSKPTSLTDFNKLGIGNMNYDAGVDQIYHAVKQIFPEDGELFHYSVLLLPAKDPRRTKVVLAYIMSFTLMCDKLHDRFVACFDEVLEENKEKVVICNEVCDLKERIAELIQQNEMEKKRLPALLEEIQNVEQNIRRHQGILSNLTTDLDKHKTAYEAKESEVQNLEKHLEQLDSEKRHYASQIVMNPNDLKAEHSRIKKALNEHGHHRETIGLELEKLRKECDVYESLIGRANDSIQNFQSVITVMKSTKAKLEFYTKSGNELSGLVRKVEYLKTEVEQLTQRHSEKIREADLRKKVHESKVERVQKEIKNLERQIQDIRDQQKAAMYELEKLQESICQMDEEIRRLQIQLAQYTHEVMVSIPHRTEVLIAESRSGLEDVFNTLAGQLPFAKPED